MHIYKKEGSDPAFPYAFVSPFLGHVVRIDAMRSTKCAPGRRQSVICMAEKDASKKSQRAKRPARKPSSNDSKADSSRRKTEGTRQEAGVSKKNGTESLGETPRDPIYNSTLLTAMRDYFGDDGREMEDYIKRPCNAQGQSMFRIVIGGSSAKDIALAKRLVESNLIRGLYYCGDNEDLVLPSAVDQDGNKVEIGMEEEVTKNVSGMAKYANLANDGEPFSAEAVVGFAKWLGADAVFVGAESSKDFDVEIEAKLAAAGITVFANDIGSSIAGGELEVQECFSSLISEVVEGEVLIE